MFRHEEENNLENYFRQSGKYKNQLFSRTQMNQSINQSRNAIIIDEGNLAQQTDINQNLLQMRKIPNRLVIGDLNTFNYTLLEKTGKNFNSRQVGAYSTQTTSPLKMQKTVNASSMFKSQSSLKNQKKLRYHKIQVQDDELNKYVHQITERVKSNQMKESQMNGNTLNPQNDSQIISINEQTPTKIQITNLIKKLTIKKRSNGPFGPILRGTNLNQPKLITIEGIIKQRFFNEKSRRVYKQKFGKISFAESFVFTAKVYTIKIKEQNREGYRTQMLGCPNIEDLKNIKIEGTNKLESEINQCYRTEANQRYFCINANLIDLDTGEKELDYSNETIVKHIDKKLLY
eukprot:403376181